MADTTIKAVITAEDRASRVIAGVGHSFRNFGNSAVQGAKQVGLLTAAVTGTAAVFATKFAVSAAVDFEQARISFETMLGSATKAGKMLKDLSAFAARTPFDLPQVVEGSKQLLAYNIEAKKIIPTFEALGNIAAGVGKEKLPFLILAFGQVRAAGRLTGQELRQFTEAGVPMISELAKHFKIAESQVREFVEEGKVGFKDVETVLFGLSKSGGKFGNLMRKQSKSLGGIFSNIKDSFIRMALDIMGFSAEGKVFEDSIFAKIKMTAQDFLKWLDANKSKISKAVNNAFEGLMNTIKDLAGWFSRNRENVGLFIKILKMVIPVAIGVGLALAIMTSPLFAFMAAIAAVTIIIFATIKLWQFLKEKTIETFNAVKNYIVNTWNNIVRITQAAGMAVVDWVTNTWNTVVNTIKSIVDRVKHELSRLHLTWAHVLGIMTGVIWRFATETIPRVQQAIINWFQKLPGRIGGILSQMWQRVVSWFSKTKSSATSSASSTVSSVTTWFGRLPSKIGSKISQIWSSAKKSFSTLKTNMIDWAKGAVEDMVSYFSGLPGRIASAVVGGAKSVGGKVGDFLQGVAGSFLSGFKAGGGSVMGGQSYLVGEKGPEVFTPPVGGGTITPNHQLTGNQSSVNLTVNIGMFSGSRIERRRVAETIYKDLLDIANRRNTTISNLIPASN